MVTLEERRKQATSTLPAHLEHGRRGWLATIRGNRRERSRGLGLGLLLSATEARRGANSRGGPGHAAARWHAVPAVPSCAIARLTAWATDGQAVDPGWRYRACVPGAPRRWHDCSGLPEPRRPPASPDGGCRGRTTRCSSPPGSRQQALPQSRRSGRAFAHPRSLHHLRGHQRATADALRHSRHRPRRPVPSEGVVIKKPPGGRATLVAGILR
jgi:hypothetical protein